ncbi:MAG: diacylglycerol kinase family protein [Clostridia bacterium]|nr:diacylglycerol kinase family protein [Clostridia bacterium]
MRYILFNPLSGNTRGETLSRALAVREENCSLMDVREISSYKDFFATVTSDDSIVLCGGDGTLNRFANDVDTLPLPCDIYYYAVGSGNDFARDIGHEPAEEPTYKINEYLQNLPRVKVAGRVRKFINGIGYGIDGYCCEIGDKIRARRQKRGNKKPINYTPIALGGLLGGFRARRATITIDGVEYRYKNVWLSPAMHGRYFGGGMMPTPNRDRLRDTDELSLMIYHGSALKALLLFRTIFSGKHVRFKNCVKILHGKKISVKYDKPCSLQIDGETMLDVDGYTAAVHSVAL